jgi:hypothetical protein
MEEIKSKIKPLSQGKCNCGCVQTEYDNAFDKGFNSGGCACACGPPINANRVDNNVPSSS